MRTKEERIALFDNFFEGTDIQNNQEQWTCFRSSLVTNGFFDAPASTKYHGSYPGGLFDHSYSVAQLLEEYTKEYNLYWVRPDSPKIIGMFHDICKMDSYLIESMDESGINYIWNDQQMILGHGDKSVMILSKYITLTQEEILCILHHMGVYLDRITVEKGYSAVQKAYAQYRKVATEYKNVLWTHHADMFASLSV